MATRRYGLSRGEVQNQLLEAVGAATAADSMEFTFDLAAGLTKEDVVKGLEHIKNYIITSALFPPA